MYHRCLIRLAFPAVLLCCAEPVAADEYASGVTVGERSFTIETERLRATFEDGVIVALANRITGELHADAARGDLGMPRGMGHLRGGVEQVERNHVAWHLSSMVLAEDAEIHELPARRDFAPFFRPAEDAEFSARPVPRGIEATWRGLTNGESTFPEEALVVRAWADAATGQLRFQASASSDDAGVVNVQVPLANLADRHRFFVPSFGGVMLDRRMTTGLKTFRGLRNYLEARVLGIEGDQGSIGLWAQDAEFHNHHLFFHWSGRSFSVAFSHPNLMPFEDHDRVDSVVYHLDAFEGGWVDAMRPYRDWYRRHFEAEMEQRAAVAWADRIRVIIDSFSPGDEDVYAHLAEKFAPETVLFHEWNARQPPFDRELPDWTPRAGYAERVGRLQELGFRTMAYVNAYCVNYNSPVFERDGIADFGLTRKMRVSRYSDRRRGEDQQSQWNGFENGELLYLDPLAPGWRTYHTDQMIRWRRETGTDANYEDVLGTAGDFGNGAVDGLFAGQGAAAQVRDLLDRNGDVPMASEYAPENVAFGVRWPLSYLTVWGSPATRRFWTHRCRPVSAFIHGPRLRPWVPILRAQDERRRHQVMAWSDALGGLAQLSGHPIELAATRGAPALLSERARLFAARQLEPHFETGRRDGDLVTRYRDSRGRTYRYEATPTLQQMLGPDGDPRYQRIHGKTAFESPLTLRGWPARTGQRYLGLNPDAHYALMPPSEDDGPTDVQIVDLPEGLMVRRYYDTDRVTVLALEPVGDERPAGDERPVGGRVELFTRAPVETLLINDRSRTAPAWDEADARSPTTAYDVDFPAYFVFIKTEVPQTARGYVGSEEETGIHLTPDVGIDIGVEFPVIQRRSWAVPDVGGTGEPGNETFRRTSSLEQVTLDYLVRVPDESSSLKLYLNSAQNVHGNGVIARLYINGRMIRAYDFGPIANPDWQPGDPSDQRDHWPEQHVHLWQVPLGEFAGQPVLITIGTDARNSTNADNFWWSRPILVADAAQAARFAALTDDGETPEQPHRVLGAEFVLEEGRSHAPSGY